MIAENHLHSRLNRPYRVQIGERSAVRVYEDSRPHFLEIAPLQKGLILLWDNRELIEEGAGFGVPVVKYSNRTYFSTSATCSIENQLSNNSKVIVIKTFTMDTVALKRVGKWLVINNDVYRFFRKTFDKVYLRPTNLSSLFNKIMEFRKRAGIETEFAVVKPKGKVVVKYEVGSTGIKISVDFSDLAKADCREILILNEQGASFFDKYFDSSGLQLIKDKIGGWEKVVAHEASMSDVGESVSFSVTRKKSVSLFRGREKTQGRFSWSGLSYSLPPENPKFCYEIKLKEFKKAPT